MSQYARPKTPLNRSERSHNVMKNAMSDPKKRRYGDFFEEITGEPISNCTSMGDIEKAVEKKTGEKLKFQYFNSTVIPRRGNVFPYSETDFEKIDNEIDAVLGTK